VQTQELEEQFRTNNIRKKYEEEQVGHGLGLLVLPSFGSLVLWFQGNGTLISERGNKRHFANFGFGFGLSSYFI